VKRNVFLFFVIPLITNCQSAESLDKEPLDNIRLYDAALDSSKEQLVFFIRDHDGGPIAGKLDHSVDDFEDIDIASPSLRNLQVALERCGEARFLISRELHEEYILVPAKKHNPFRKTSDLELVSCVREKVAFSFGAGIGRFLGIDESVFESLHAKKN